ncbi:hypothetical protein ACOMHN_049682 [Nucella lapillus]
MRKLTLADCDDDPCGHPALPHSFLKVIQHYLTHSSRSFSTTSLIPQGHPALPRSFLNVIQHYLAHSSRSSSTTSLIPQGHPALPRSFLKVIQHYLAHSSSIPLLLFVTQPTTEAALSLSVV